MAKTDVQLKQDIEQELSWVNQAGFK